MQEVSKPLHAVCRGPESMLKVGGFLEGETLMNFSGGAGCGTCLERPDYFPWPFNPSSGAIGTWDDWSANTYIS